MHTLLKCFLLFFCIFLLSLNVNAGVKKSPASAQKNPTIKDKPKINQANQISLKIQSIALKNNIIHVTIATVKIILPKDYAGITLHVTTPQHKAGKKWTLQAVDSKHLLSLPKKPVTFNTKIRLTAPGKVTATLSKGIWKTLRMINLSPAKGMAVRTAPAGQKSTKTGSKKLTEMQLQGKGPQKKATTRKPVVPMISENREVTSSVSPPVNSRILERREESSETESGIYGDRPYASARKAVEFPIHIIAPVGNDRVLWGRTTQIRWTMPENDEAGNCGNIVDIYAIRERSSNRIRLTQVAAEPGDNNWTWLVNSGTITPGTRYHIEIESLEGCKIRGAAFEVQSCDYAIESVTFRNGRSLATGVDARDGSTISGTFRVRVRWNGIELPSTFAPGTEWGNLMKVRSTLTNDTINIPASGINFDYTDATATGIAGTPFLINVDVPFEFARDDIAHMMTDTRNIPLEFSFEPTGASMDTNAGNNSLTANMKASFANVVNFQLLMSPHEFAIDRDRHLRGTAPIYDFNFTQRINVRNVATTVMGTAPADLLNVPVAWYIEWRPAGASEWSPLPINQGRFLYPAVRADADLSEPPLHIAGHFSTTIGHPGRAYRLRVVVDPDREYLDPDRISNRAFFTIDLPD